MAKLKRYKVVKTKVGYGVKDIFTGKLVISEVGKPAAEYECHLLNNSERESNPSTETDWIPVHAIRKLPDGSIQLLTEKGTLSNPSKRKSFMGKVRKLFSKNPSARYTGREVRKYIVRGTDEDRYFMTMAKARSFLKRYAKLHGYRSIPESPYWIEKSETRDTF